MNLLSEHNRILRVGEGGSQEYFPGDNINITDHVISGKYWDNEINSAISSTSGDIVNEAFNQSTAWTEEKGYLTAHQDVSNLPYVQNSALGYNGNLISSISGDGFFAESANNSYHADDADHATYADSATHADFVATANFANSATSALNSEVANVAYTALTAQYLDGGWEHDGSGNITAYNNSAFVGSNGGQYEGISPIVVNNEEMKISAKSALLGVQQPLYFVEDSETATVIGIDSGAFPTFEGTEDGKISAINGSALNADPIIPYSGGSNISVDNYIISVTGSVPSADRTDYAVSATSSHYSHSAIEAGSANYATESNHTHSADSATYDSLGRKIVDTYLTAHQDWTPTIQNASGNAYSSAVNWVVDQHYLTAVTGDNTPYSAGANISINDHVISGKDWTSEIQAASANAVNTITAVDFANSASALTTSAGWDVTEYSAGPNIVINNHIIGLDSAVELTNITANRGAILDPSGLYVSNLNQTEYTEIGKDHVFSVDGSAHIGWQLGDGNNKSIDIWNNSGNGNYAQLLLGLDDVLLQERHLDPTPDKVYSLTGACTSAISAINMINSGDSQAYTAGDNINISNHVISGKNWNTEIAEASSYAYNQATAQGGGQGVEYTGIAPIVVNNVEHKISAQSAKLGVQSPLYFVEDSTTATVIGISGLPTVEGVMYESALGLFNGYITGYNNSAFSAERSRYAVSATSANGAISAQQALQTSGGNSLQGLYDFVSTNSGSWTGAYFPMSADEACQVVTANSANWGDIPTKVVANSSLATGSNILYIVTGS